MRTYSCLPIQTLTNGAYSILPVQDEHIDSIRQWRNAQMDVLRQSAVISAEQQQQYFARQIWPDMARAQPSNLLVSYLLDDTLIGYGGLVHIAWAHRRAEVSFLVSPHRAATATVYTRDLETFLRLIKILAFEQLGLHRLCTEIYAIRPRHITIFEANGFVREGVLRQHVWIKGRAVDTIVHGCLRSDPA